MKNNSAVGILSVGMHVPQQIRRNDWWPASFTEQFAERAKLDVTTPEVFLERAKTPAQRIQLKQMLETYHDPFRGSIERRVLEEGLHPSSMEIEAARQAVSRAGIDASELDVILSFSMPSDECMPPNAGIIQAALGAKRAVAMGVDTACASSLTAMHLGESLIRSGAAKYVLVVTSTTLSRLTDPEDVGSVNFGDGAGAFVLGPVPAGLGFQGTAQRSIGELHSGVCIGPKHDEPWYSKGGPMFLYSRHLKVGREIAMGSADFAKEAVEAVLRKAGLEAKDVTHFYSHQPVAWFSDACRIASGLEHCQTTSTFPLLGGMGSANVAINLCRAWEKGQVRPGDQALLYACGGGFLWAATIVRWSAAPLNA